MQLNELIYVELNFLVDEKLDHIYYIQTVFHLYEYARREDEKKLFSIVEYCIFFTLCVTNVLLLEKAREHISHLYFFKFLDFVVSLFEFLDWRRISINEGFDGIWMLLFVKWWVLVIDALGRIGDDDGGINPGGRRNGNVCQKDRYGTERNDRSKARCAWKSFVEEINGEKKGFEIGGNSSELDFIDDFSSLLTGLSDAK